MTDNELSPSAAADQLLAVGLRSFFRIAAAWRMTDQEAASTLGTVADSLSAARAGDSSAVAPDALLRISYVLAIFRAINTLLPLPESADTWMQEKQIQPPFLGRRAIDMLASGNAAEIASLRAYLKDGLDG